jgi:GTP-binding protein
MPNESSQTKRRVVAIVGQPNVGKSAIFNRLAKSRIAIVHEESGVTRDRLMCEVSWNGELFELIDTGGVCNIDGARTRGETESGVRNQVETALADAAVVVFVGCQGTQEERLLHDRCWEQG